MCEYMVGLKQGVEEDEGVSSQDLSSKLFPSMSSESEQCGKDARDTIHLTVFN